MPSWSALHSGDSLGMRMGLLVSIDDYGLVGAQLLVIGSTWAYAGTGQRYDWISLRSRRVGI